MSGAADHGRYRKTLLLSFAFTGAVATMLFLPVTSSVYLLASLWAIIGNVCFGASFVLLNSFLPILVRYSPEIQLPGRTTDADMPLAYDDDEGTGDQDEPTAADVIDSSAALLPGSEQPAPYPPSPAASSPEMQLSTKISSYGVGVGYIAAVILQSLSFLILTELGATVFSLRLVLFTVGLWWAAFTVPAALFLRPRPGPLLAFGKAGKTRTWAGYLVFSWVKLGKTIVRARRLKDVLLFLAAWFMISDAVATVSGTAVLFAKTTLGMEPAALSLINVIVTLSGIAGAFTWSKVSRMMQLKPSQTILACICIFELIPL